MKRTLVATLVLSILSANVAVAQLSPGTTAPEIDAEEWLNTDEPLELRDLRGMMVVLYFWVSFHEGGKHRIGTLNALDTNPQFGRAQGCVVIGLTSGDKVGAEVLMDSEKVFFPVGVGSKTADAYRISVFPSVAIIDPKGKIVYVGGLPNNINGLVGHVRGVFNKTPPTRTHPEKAAETRAHLESARTAIRARKYRKAFTESRAAFETALRGDTLKTQCQEMLDLIDAIGADQLAGVDGLVDGRKFGDAVALLRSVSGDFRGLDSGKAARERLAALKKQHSEIAGLLEGQENESEARSTMFAAQRTLRKRKFGEAFIAFEKISKDYGGTETAAAAIRICERMTANAQVGQAVKEYKAKLECGPLLSQARNYIRARRYGKAKEILREVIRKHPDTTYEEKAMNELKKLP